MIYKRLGTDADLNVLLSDVKSTYSGRGVELVETGGACGAAAVAPYLTIEKDGGSQAFARRTEDCGDWAYHQPITRAEIENIRGVATHKGTLDALMEMGWVKLDNDAKRRGAR